MPAHLPGRRCTPARPGLGPEAPDAADGDRPCTALPRQVTPDRRPTPGNVWRAHRPHRLLRENVEAQARRAQGREPPPMPSGTVRAPPPARVSSPTSLASPRRAWAGERRRRTVRAGPSGPTQHRAPPEDRPAERVAPRDGHGRDGAFRRRRAGRSGSHGGRVLPQLHHPALASALAKGMWSAPRGVAGAGDGREAPRPVAQTGEDTALRRGGADGRGRARAGR